MGKPNIEEFLGWVDDVELSDYQKELAEALIAYRVKHHSGGLGGGRTTVIEKVQEYIEDKYPGNGEVGREI